MAKTDTELSAHRAWLGLLQPVGLVVSPPALLKAQAVLDRNVVELQQTLRSLLRHPPRASAQNRLATGDEPAPYLDDFPLFVDRVLGWDDGDLLSGDGLPENLEVVLPDYGETLRPTYAVIDAMAGDKVLLLVWEMPLGTVLDDPSREEKKTGWHASPQAKLERLLREKEVDAGLLLNGHELRLVYAPRGESSGHVTFPIPAMCEVSGRPILAALQLLLSEHRVFSAPDGRRLLNLLVESRKYQNEVSNKLSEQVLGALWELLRGFQAADEVAGRLLVDHIAREDPDHIYGGLLTVLMRLVFLLYAEDEGLMPDDPVYVRNYSVVGLFDRLREDEGRYPDTMDQRYGAWASLISLFRLVYDGGGHTGFELPTRHGQLFNPDSYSFLEGRPHKVARVMGERIEVPRVSDGCVYRVLRGLLVLEGERLSYRALDVEQIGSVYEAMMGFSVERSFGTALGVRRRKKGMNLDIVFDVDELLEVEAGKRKKWLQEKAECDLTGKAAKALKEATTAQDVAAALGRKLSPWTARPLPAGSLFLQPGEERRRSGSHYTPRELTEPIVRTTLRPVLEGLGERPKPEQILDLKVCDPAMGSGAFLVEACRQLAEALVRAWEVHDCLPALPADEDSLLHARRLVAQRCLYGVDKNPFAVNLAKLSLWLVTLAKNHAFTFLDHALKQGDSLVGLSRDQIAAFHWKEQKKDWGPLFEGITESVEVASAWREKIQDLDEGDYEGKKEAWREAEDVLCEARLVGDMVVAAFFGAERDKGREELRLVYQKKIDDWRLGTGGSAELQRVAYKLRGDEQSVSPFHWDIEFPEVFVRKKPGFATMVGNPPFLGGTIISTELSSNYLAWLISNNEDTGNRTDLVAYFFRRSYLLLQDYGTLGLVATNTIAQGDTRRGGLRYICLNGGFIYSAIRRYRWPGAAVVMASIVHLRKGMSTARLTIDGQAVSRISAYLFHRGTDLDPHQLKMNQGCAFTGVKHYGDGFLFEDGKAKATPLSEMERLIAKNPKNQAMIYPFIGGAEINSSPTHSCHRYIINFGDLSEMDARKFPDLVGIVETKVRPERLSKAADVAAWPWWQFWRPRRELYEAINDTEQVLSCAIHSKHLCFAFLPSASVMSHGLTVFALHASASFCGLQSRSHEIWSRFFGSSMKDDLRYTPSDCFETFPFPKNWQTDTTLKVAGKTYYEFRANLMIHNNEGLTKTYNRFHDPNENDPEIQKLRDLHAAMDRAVLDAYGWTDIPTHCEFLLDYEIDEETWGKKKKPYRYRWPEDIHDEVLARLLDLNQKRYQEEVLAGLHAEKKKPARKAAKKPARKKKEPPSNQGSLFD